MPSLRLRLCAEAVATRGREGDGDCKRGVGTQVATMRGPANPQPDWVALCSLSPDVRVVFQLAATEFEEVGVRWSNGLCGLSV